MRKPFPSLKSAFQKLKSDEELNEKDLMSLENLVETFSSVCIDPSIVGEATAGIIREVNTHSHTVTCRKGDRVDCRFRFPRYPSAITIIQRPWRLFKGKEDEKKCTPVIPIKLAKNEQFYNDEWEKLNSVEIDYF